VRVALLPVAEDPAQPGRITGVRVQLTLEPAVPENSAPTAAAQGGTSPAAAAPGAPTPSVVGSDAGGQPTPAPLVRERIIEEPIVHVALLPAAVDPTQPGRITGVRVQLSVVGVSGSIPPAAASEPTADSEADSDAGDEGPAGDTSSEADADSSDSGDETAAGASSEVAGDASGSDDEAAASDSETDELAFDPRMLACAWARSSTAGRKRDAYPPGEGGGAGGNALGPVKSASAGRRRRQQETGGSGGGGGEWGEAPIGELPASGKQRASRAGRWSQQW
jgi:hypothetical protein